MLDRVPKQDIAFTPLILRMTPHSFDEAAEGIRQKIRLCRSIRQLSFEPRKHMLRHVALSDVTFSAAFTNSYEAEFDLEAWGIGFVQAGIITCASQSLEARLSSGRGMLVPPGPAKLRTENGSVGTWVSLSADAVALAVSSLTGADPSRLIARSRPLAHSASVHRLMRLVSSAIDLIEDRPEHSEPYSGRLKVLEQLILLEAAAALLGHADHPVADYDLHRLARAEEFMAANLSQAIGPGQIAQAAGMSVRTLQYAFQKHHGLTPGAFLKDLRMHKARSLLLYGDGPLRVADVATQCGFTNPGEFSAAYAERFGEKPSQTARAARGLVPAF